MAKSSEEFTESLTRAIDLTSSAIGNVVMYSRNTNFLEEMKNLITYKNSQILNGNAQVYF